MTINARKITVLMSIFFTLFFGFNVNAQTWHCNWIPPATDCGDIFYLYYDVNDNISSLIDYSNTITNHWNSDFYFNSDEVIFQSSTSQQSAWQYGYVKFKYNNINYFFSNPVADIGNTRTNNTNCFGSYSGDIVFIERGNTAIVKFRQLNNFSGTVLAFNTNGLTKSNIDTALGVNALENATVGFSSLMYNDIDTNYCHDNSTDVDYPLGFAFPLSYTPPAPINAICGPDNGETTNQEPPVPPRTLCQAGNETEVIFSGIDWTWTCEGINGGSNDDCISYNTEPVNAICGLYDGNYYDEPPTTPEDFCELGNLIFPSFVKTSLGWTWTCAGFNGGNNSFCTAYENMGNLPELPEQDDCSLQDIPDRWFCEISNSLKSIFLPDSEKLNELETTINKINGRFPFNYLAVASSRLETLKENTNNDTITISLLDNEGEVNLQAIEPLSEKLKIYTAGLFIIGFIFWAIGYIKNFFK